MGSGSEEHADLAGPLGEALARAGYNLLTGGGGGVMTAVSRSFVSVADRSGLAIGVLPGDVGERGEYRPRPGYPNEHVEIVIRTHLPLVGEHGADPLSRNHLNVLSSDAIVALPGGAGTRSEVELAVRYGRPVIRYLRAGDPGPGDPRGVPIARDVEAVLRFIADIA